MAEMTARILRIEKISLTDGPGMRTVVFFKGCPLQCAWCSTPEGQRPEPEPYYRERLCLRCGECVKACPYGALSLTPEGVFRDRSRCRDCLACTQVCPTNAQSAYGREMTLKEVIRVIERDSVYYFHSGGGVTLSGGDVLLQADFAAALLRECAEAGIHTMAELDMFGPFSEVKKLLPYLDAFYADIKLMDSERHKAYTGAGNGTILENIRLADGACRKNAICLRVPLIPGINDDEENLRATAAFADSLNNCSELEFLPYHRLGSATYAYLQRGYSLSELPAMTEEQALRALLPVLKRPHNYPVKLSGRIVS